MAKISLSVEAKMKSFFFDRQRVRDAIGRAERRVLSRQGAYLRGAAKRQPRRRKRSSRPGETPTHWSSDRYASLKNIWFTYEPSKRMVVVGPVRVGTRVNVPQLMEHGGTVTFRGKRVRIRPRKYMRAAYEASRDKLNKMWAGAVKT